MTRSTQEATDQIQQVLHWLGLEWDEGPLLQSHRFETYLSAADRMVDEGHAYECFCLEAEVKERNEEAIKAGRAPGYDGRCRDLAPGERDAQRAAGKPRSIRFRTAEAGRSVFEDAIRGEVAVDWSTISDFVIVRSNGTPVFFLANARRRHRHADHPRVTRRRPHRLDPPGARAPARPRCRRSAGIRPPAAHHRTRRRQAVEAARRAERRGLPRRRISPSCLGELPGAARMGAGRRPRDPRHRGDRRRVRHRSHQPFGRRLRPEEARVDERASTSAACRSRSSPAPRCRSPRRATPRHLDVRVFETAVALAQERSTTLVQIAEQSAFLFTSDDVFEIDDEVVRGDREAGSGRRGARRRDRPPRDVRTVGTRGDRPPAGHREPRPQSRART